MTKMKDLTATPLANYSHEWKVVPQQIVCHRSNQVSRWLTLRYGEDPGGRLPVFVSKASRSKDSTTSV